MRPAEVWGCTMSPSRSRTVISFRTVALETPSSRERAIVWEPTGCAVSTYSSTIARKICDLRSSSSAIALDSRSAGDAWGRRLALQSTECQCRPVPLGGGEEAGRDVGREKAAAPGEHDAVGDGHEEPGSAELTHDVAASAERDRAPPGSEREPELLGLGCGRVEVLLPRDGRAASTDGVDVPLGGAHVPPTPAAGVPMSGAPDGDVLALRPVQLVVAAGASGSRPVGDLVPLVARGAQRVVDDLVLCGLVVVVRWQGAAVVDSASERRRRLDRERVRAHV